ncbi:hypothetical protein SEA_BENTHERDUNTHAT_65 [Gordonia phage BENtherdunthat]|uniref:dATP/dGTP diphosphohydrolase MazZ domain-containing protein n=1 Tax=Gordonia phage BENtherdunthat TaxID=2047830 RepID=A0A2H4PF37_9CAUD|nr:nucleotide pyrophosphohydrolase [Gordonia phage BENtherdunthat]ATW60835.1 hypothetical protein SEA_BENTHERDUNTHAT_65 [Gordonia phage BENtherdunthat]
MSDNVIDAKHIARQREFSLRTFGPGLRTEGVIDHIAKELDEIRGAPTDLSEWADVIILAFDGAQRTGADPQAILDAIVAKQTKNEARQWPDWRTQEPGKAIEHVRDHLPDEEPHYSCTRSNCCEGDPGNCWVTELGGDS